MNKLRHIILFKIKDSVDESRINHAIELLRSLGKNDDSILEWRIEKSLDERKGIIIVENSLFKSEEDLLSFRSSEKHLKVVDFMKEIADWTNGDYIESEQ